MDSDDRVVRDGEGRHIIFHGVNMVLKHPPYIPEQTSFDPMMSLSQEDIDLLKGWGIN